MFRSKNTQTTQQQKQQQQQQQQQTPHKNPGSIHVVFGATCSKSMDWKSIGVFHSFYTSGWGQPRNTNAKGKTNVKDKTKTKTNAKAKITRLLACTEDQMASYKGMDIGPTFVFPDRQSMEGYTDSPTYNKPAGIMHFTSEVDIEEEYILFIDADMLLRRVISLDDNDGDGDGDPFGFNSYANVVKKGVVMTEWVWYIQEGIQNGLAKQFLTNTNGNFNANADAVRRASTTHGGYYHLFHVDDARAVAPLWLHYTQMFRHHPEKYWSKLEGSTLKEDIDTVQKGIEYGGVPWISEMYGYAFAAAEIGLEHKFTRGGGGVLYGDDFLTLNHDGPFLSHYTLSCHVPSIEIFTNHPKNHHHHHNKDNKGEDEEEDDDEEEDFYFNKDNFHDFDPLDCHDGFLFPQPNIHLVDEGSALCAENVQRLNTALCHFYKLNCPDRTRAYQRAISHCPWDTGAPFQLHQRQVKPSDCGNRLSEDDCREEVQDGQCLDNPSFMQLSCLEACGFCATDQPRYNNNNKNNNNHHHRHHHRHRHEECADLAGTQVCSDLAHEMLCILNPTYMVVNCRKTCGKCPIMNDDDMNGREREPTTDTDTAKGTDTGKLIGHVPPTSSREKIEFITAICTVIVLLFVLQKIFWRFLSPRRDQNKKST